MSGYVPLSKTRHREAGVVAARHKHALEQALVPVVAEELPQVVATMTTAFAPTTEGTGFELVALQSLQPGVNVYVHTDGRWIGGYRPAWYRAHPFKVAQGKDGGQRVVCVDESSEAFEMHATEQAQRLFDEGGELTERASETLAFLKQLDETAYRTRAAVKQLDDAGLIVPWDLNARNPEGESGFEVRGVFHIDEPAMRALPEGELGKLARSGALSVAYTQLLSEHRLAGLTRLYRLRRLAIEQAKPDDVDLEDLFGDDDDDLSFNF